VTTSNLNRPSILYEAYGGEWEVLALRILAAPVYVTLLGLCIWGVIGPTIFVRTRLRHKKMARALRNAGIELTNPAVKSILELGTDIIEPFVRYIDNVTATGSAESAENRRKYIGQNNTLVNKWPYFGKKCGRIAEAE
jgi:hypothetical protein